MLSYLTLPTASSTFEGMAPWFNTIIDEFWPWALIAIGVSLAFGGIAWIIGHFQHKK